jgi:long-chain acyl-CoA synthetase
LNLASIIDDHDAARPALIDGDDVISYGDLRTLVDATRAVLVSEGFGPGDRIAVAAGNEPHFVVGVLAALGLGGAVVPINASTPVPELRRKLEAARPDVILLGDAGRWLAEHAADIDCRLLDMETLMTMSAPPTPIAARADDDLAFLMLTSGVSGESKVAMLTHHNLGWMQESIIGPEGLTPDDITLGTLPFVHIFGLNVVLLTSLRVGALVVLQRRFDVDESLALVRRHGVTSLTGAPPMWQRWAAADAPDDSLASVDFASSGAAALPIEVFEAIRARYGVEIAEGYGLTETSPIVTWSRNMPVKATSVGRPLPGVDVVLVEPDGSPVDPGDTGEIVVRSPGVFQGYLDAPDTTHAVLTDDGWFWTGDVGVFDADGYLYLVDRVKDIIIVSGFNVYPSEVENVLMEHPDVRGAVVVGSPHAETGEAVVAHVSGHVDRDDLDAFTRARLSRYKCPTEYNFVDDLPVAPTGKLIRRELR